MRKPRGFTPIKLPPMQPDCCAECPLVGLIPDDYADRPKWSKETHVCLGTMEALSKRGLKIRASKRDAKHPWQRPCDHHWQKWVEHLPERYFTIRDEDDMRFRRPYFRSLETKIKFHR